MILREVKPDDMRFLYDLRNHPEIRAVSHSTKVFTYDEHCDWWRLKLTTRGCEASIIEYEDKSVGVIRRNGEYISIAILPGYQNQGLGTKAIQSFSKKGDVANALCGNIRSIHTFEKAGFKKAYIVLIKD